MSIGGRIGVARTLTLALVGLAVLGSTGPARGERLQHWVAMSRTSVAITGDIELGSSRIVFQNRKSLALSYVGGTRGVTWAPDARDAPVAVFRILHPADLVLLNGNRLCGTPTPPTYLTVYRTVPASGDGHRTVLYLTALTGRGAPTPADYAPRICAGYDYVQP